MKLQHLKGNTYALETHTPETNTASIGLYLFPDQRCLLIDSGANPTQGQALLQILEEKGWTVSAIFNTHAHADHCGGNHYIQQVSHCRIYASAIESAFIQQPILNPYTVYGAYPLKLLQSKFFLPQASRVSAAISAGRMEINGQEFEILDLGGHTLGHLGIRTPDNVVFTGDSLISPEILHSNPFLYLADPSQQIATLEKIRADKSALLYLSHGGITDNISALIRANYEILMQIQATLKHILRTSRNREEIINEVITRQGLQVNRNHYFRLGASISAFLAYLCNSGQATVYIEKDSLQYCAKA
ncbi:MAG: MBL fold metallo-hydrolase [Syntrophomonadaceae bacterium]|nr:MBL fold metallo-hydrolase [Syntrophomonadaceae bacterium]